MIRIITDSTCDISKADAAALGIDIVPLTVSFGHEEFLDGKNLSHEEFYNRLRECDELPVTSQPSPIVFEDLFRKYVENSDVILGIFISSKLSGTFQSASIAAGVVMEEYSNAQIQLVDSKNVSLGTSLLIYEAVRMRDNGDSLEKIAAVCTDMASHVKLYAMAGSLKYLQKGGRLSSSAALVGSFLKITPVITIVDGAVEIACKARGRKSASSYISKELEQASLVPSSTFFYGHADAEEFLNSFKSATKDFVQDIKPLTGSIGCIVGTHIGPGSFGIAYIERTA